MGSFWYDERIVYRYPDIQVTSDLYVIDTRLCELEEVKSLLYYSEKKINNQYDMLSYLLTFKPDAYKLTEKITNTTLYTTSVGNFILSTDPGKMLLGEDVNMVRNASKDVYYHMLDNLQACDNALLYVKNLLRKK